MTQAHAREVCRDRRNTDGGGRRREERRRAGPHASPSSRQTGDTECDEEGSAPSGWRNVTCSVFFLFPAADAAVCAEQNHKTKKGGDWKQSLSLFPLLQGNGNKRESCLSRLSTRCARALKIGSRRSTPAPGPFAAPRRDGRPGNSLAISGSVANNLVSCSCCILRSGEDAGNMAVRHFLSQWPLEVLHSKTPNNSIEMNGPTCWIDLSFRSATPPHFFRVLPHDTVFP